MIWKQGQFFSTILYHGTDLRFVIFVHKSLRKNHQKNPTYRRSATNLTVSFGWEVEPFRANRMEYMKLFLFLVLLPLCAKANDEEKIAQAWKNTLIDNMKTIADFSAKVMRPSSTQFLANQDGIYKEKVKNRIRPLVDNDGIFEDMFQSMTLDLDCYDPEDPPVLVNDLGSTNFILKSSIADWVKAECKRRIELREAFKGIDAFHELTNANFEDFCSSFSRAKLTIKEKMNDFVAALQDTDDVVSEIFEDISRRSGSGAKPLAISYRRSFENTAENLFQEFLSRIQAETLTEPCPAIGSENQFEINTRPRSTRPTTSTTTTTTTTRSETTPETVNPRFTTTMTTTTVTSGINQFLLNAFNLGK